MHQIKSRCLRSGLVLLGVIVGLAGCANKKYVREQVGTLEPALREVNNAVKENAERIDAVDKRAQQGVSAAQAADQRAMQANIAAQTAQQTAQAANKIAETANQGVQQANNRISTLDARLNSTTDDYTASATQSVTFSFNSWVLSNPAKGMLDKIANDVSSQGNGYKIELQGFTDGIGSEEYNVSLSQLRSQAVARYLVTKSVPLYRISILGLGTANPVADNTTRIGRDQNRRVELRLLRSATLRSSTNN